MDESAGLPGDPETAARRHSGTPGQGAAGGRECGPGGRGAGGKSHFALGTWLNSQKVCGAKLTPGQLTQLAEHGMEMGVGV